MENQLFTGEWTEGQEEAGQSRFTDVEPEAQLAHSRHVEQGFRTSQLLVCG